MSATNGLGFHFIVSTSSEQTNAETRKFIRSHVMRGRNRVKSRAGKQPGTTKCAIMVNPNYSPRAISQDQLVETCYSFIPKRVGSDLSFINFAAEITPAMFGDVLKFCAIVMKVKFPLGGFISWEKNDSTCFDLLALDAAYLHITAFAAGAFIGQILGQPNHATSQEATLHYLKGVRLLREKLLLRDDEGNLSDATVSVVLTLANCAYGMGEYEAAKRHLEGLHKISKLRGGLPHFRHSNFSKRLLSQMLRVDIGLALQTSSKPIFFGDPLLEPLPPYPDQKLWVVGKSIDMSNSQRFLDDLDGDLRASWLALQRFCSLVNLAMETHRMFPMDIVMDTMAAVMYRLLHMSFQPGSIDEVIRQGLLSLSYHMFLQWQDLGFLCFHFPSIYKTTLSNLKHKDGLPPPIMLWLLMVGGLSRFTSLDDKWLKDSLQEHLEICLVKSWNELRDVLKSFMWISLLHDKQGKDIFDFVLKP